MSLAIRVRPDRPSSWSCSWHAGDHPAEDDLGLLGDGREVGDAVASPGAESVARAGPAGGSTCRSRGPSSPRPAARRRASRGRRAGPARGGRCRCRCRSRWPRGVGSNRPNMSTWPRRRDSCAAWPSLTARGRTASHWSRCPPSRSNAPALISASTQAELTTPAGTRSNRSVRAGERPVLLPGRDDRLDRLEPDALDRQPGRTGSSPAAATVNSARPSLMSGGRTSRPIRRQSSMCSTKNFSRSAPSISRGEDGGHELGRVVGLEPGGLVEHQGVGRRVRLVEAVAAEELDQVEDLGRLARSIYPAWSTARRRRTACGTGRSAPSSSWRSP